MYLDAEPVKARRKYTNSCFVSVCVCVLMSVFLQIILNVISHFKENHDI